MTLAEAMSGDRVEVPGVGQVVIEYTVAGRPTPGSVRVYYQRDGYRRHMVLPGTTPTVDA